MKYSLDILCSKCGNSDLKHVFPIEQTLKAFDNVKGAVLGCPICDQVMWVESYDRSGKQYFKTGVATWGYKEGRENYERELKEHGFDYIYPKGADRYGLTLSDRLIKDISVNGRSPMTGDPSYCCLNLFIGEEGNTLYNVTLSEKELIEACKIVEEEKYKMFKEEYTK